MPAGNTYSLENVCRRDVKLFFAQCRKTKRVGNGVGGDVSVFTQVSDTSYGLDHGDWPREAVLLGGYGVRNDRDGEEEGGEEDQEEIEEAGEGESEEEQQYRKSMGAAKKSHSDKVQGKAGKQPRMNADSDEDSQAEEEDDDFETSRQKVKSKKKRIFRKL